MGRSHCMELGFHSMGSFARERVRNKDAPVLFKDMSALAA